MFGEEEDEGGAQRTYDDEHAWELMAAAMGSHHYDAIQAPEPAGTDLQTINCPTAQWEDEPIRDESSSTFNCSPGVVVVPLEGGGFHVCRGQNCPHASIQHEDREKELVCELSGRVIASAIETAQDASWTGRSCGSADPDMTSGAVSARSWRNKRDAFAESARAYNKAKQFTDEDLSFATSSYTVPKSTTLADVEDDSKLVKRGAPCVSEIDEAAVSQHKREKAIRRISSLTRRDVQARLRTDAFLVVQKLLVTVASTSQDNAKTQAAQGDPRLENFNFVFAVGMKKYVDRCAARNEQPNLCTMHDVAVCASNYVKERRKDASKLRIQSMMRMFAVNTQTMELCARLIVAVWNALCSTSHFVENQPGDSFRPFAAGIMYGMKRGLRLKSSLVVVPCMEILANQLPTLRSSSGNAETRQLQASSHRGLCAVHRALASIDTMSEEDRKPVIERLNVAASISEALQGSAERYMAQDKDRAS